MSDGTSDGVVWVEESRSDARGRPAGPLPRLVSGGRSRRFLGRGARFPPSGLLVPGVLAGLLLLVAVAVAKDWLRADAAIDVAEQRAGQLDAGLAQLAEVRRREARTSGTLVSARLAQRAALERTCEDDAWCAPRFTHVDLALARARQLAADAGESADASGAPDAEAVPAPRLLASEIAGLRAEAVFLGRGWKADVANAEASALETAP